MKYIVSINNKEYEVEVERGKANIIRTATIVPPDAPVVKAAPEPEKKQSAAPATEGTPIEAPFSGTILQTKAEVGARVTKGEVLLILEAMKMENEILAPCDGTVAQWSVAKGASVSTGDLLVILR